MSTPERTSLTATVAVNAPIDKVWELWTGPEHIAQWNTMSAEWQCTDVQNNVRPGGKFLFVMGLKDGSFGFDYKGTYDVVTPNELIAYTLGDGRKTVTTFTRGGNTVFISETFDADGNEPIEMQQGFCQAVLDNFKRYTEANIA